MKLTQNDIIKLENQAFYIYQEFQATMAGQAMSDVDALQSHFEEVAELNLVKIVSHYGISVNLFTSSI